MSLILPNGFRRTRRDPHVGKSCLVNPWMDHLRNRGPRPAKILQTVYLGDAINLARSKNTALDNSPATTPIIGYFVQFDDESEVHPEMIGSNFFEGVPQS